MDAVPVYESPGGSECPATPHGVSTAEYPRLSTVDRRIEVDRDRSADCSNLLISVVVVRLDSSPMSTRRNDYGLHGVSRYTGCPQANPEASQEDHQTLPRFPLASPPHDSRHFSKKVTGLDLCAAADF